MTEIIIIAYLLWNYWSLKYEMYTILEVVILGRATNLGQYEIFFWAGCGRYILIILIEVAWVDGLGDNTFANWAVVQVAQEST